MPPRVFVCHDGKVPDGMVCPAGPDGCGYCLGKRCDQAVPDGRQEWMVDVDGMVVWPDDEDET